MCGAVDRKRRELARVGEAIQEIEATRERKMSEFRRMQANLMELLHEQKTELDAVREKGVQLEVRAREEIGSGGSGMLASRGWGVGRGEAEY